MLKKFLITTSAIILMYLVFFFWPVPANQDMLLGASFSPTYARYLNLDPKIVFDKIVNEWHFKHLRFSAQWNEMEKEPNKFDFVELDYYMNEATKHGAKVILAMGQKTPRWPECHAPDWTRSLTDEEYFVALNKYIETVIKKYQNHPAFEMWQVENEPFLAFGEQCRKMTDKQLATEVEWARASNKPVLVTDSGELSYWQRTAKAGDWFGTTLYRVVWNKYLGYFNYDWLPAGFYRLKFRLSGRDLNTAMVAELQAEPWLPGLNIESVSLVEQAKSMNLKRLQKNIAYARKLGVSRAYLWGAEWWVWLDGKGDQAIGEYIKNLDKDKPVFMLAP